ncbi:hypothetical protein L596_008030 [Steinernema carpocapsae]|uniref:Uncharacterized protein n=1 Tax=Steinernema carpocapsae TaxID=34508 RepID=A0A4U5PC96_STECR|nr:hypothetical protein L596_008030 [Steinernema carpocapsae]
MVSRSSSLHSMDSSSALYEISPPHFWSSLGVVFTYGLLLLAIGSIPLLAPIKGLFALLTAGFLFHWYRIHGHKLTKAEHFLFEETNLLATTNRFEFEDGPLLGDDITPGGSRLPVDCCGKATLNPKAFAENDRMQKFYELHYKGVYSTARRRAAERQATEKNEEGPPATKSVESKKSV